MCQGLSIVSFLLLMIGGSDFDKTVDPWMTDVNKKRVCIPYQDFDCFLHGEEVPSKQSTFFSKSNRYKFIYYVDESECSVCLIKVFYQWDEVIDAIGRDDIEYCFIIKPSDIRDLPYLISAMRENYFSQPIYIDTEGRFFQTNRELFDEGMGHCLFLSPEGNVLIEGNPMHSPAILQRMKNMREMK